MSFRLFLKAGAKVQLLFNLASFFEKKIKKILFRFTHSINLRTSLILRTAKVIRFLILANFFEKKFFFFYQSTTLRYLFNLLMNLP
jgi:hypothetical protein